ncbi:hypothetical protein PQZ39_01295 [bacterium]|nr:hypothetical protein [bacterium]
MDNKKKEARAQLEALRELKRRKNLKDYSDNFEKFSSDQIRIITKDATKGFVPFRFNEAQTIINEALEKQRKETGKVRAIILKARQQGISTFCAGRVFWKTYFQQHTRSVVMAHDSATSDSLFSMSKNLIKNMEKGLQPKLEKTNAKEIAIQTPAYTDKDAVGSYRLYTAGSPEAGRGTTPTILHASEVAFWQHDAKILAGLFQGISQADGTEVIIESTANGASGEFYRLYQAAAAGESDYIAIFIPWFKTVEYQREVPEEFELTFEEKDYKEKYELTDEQIYWRRLKIVEGGVDKFRQEYPANAEEAFLVSGSSVFNPEKINSFLPVQPIALRLYNEDLGSFDDSPRGNLEIWIPPDWKDNYIIGADVALGVKQDYSTAIVLNTQGHICAMYRDNTVDPTLYGEHLFYLGRYFNNALLAVESNSMGVATLQRLKQMSYINMYYETKAAKLSSEEGQTPGFRMTHGSKPRVIGQLKNAVEEEDIWIPSKTILSEMKTYISTSSGKTEAIQGRNDDTVMALAIAWEAYRTNIDKLSNQKVDWRQKNFVNRNNEEWI